VVGGYLSPASDQYNKASLIPAVHRVALCEAAVADSDWLMV
jgi:nicotinamide mononucleotide adenylyltransferase